VHRRDHRCDLFLKEEVFGATGGDGPERWLVEGIDVDGAVVCQVVDQFIEEAKLG
jgi:hypothetical protein